MLTRREALIGAGAVVASAALPILPTQKTLLAGPLVEIATGTELDVLAAIWGITRVGKHLSGVPLQEVLVESDAHLRERVIDFIMRGWPRFVDETTKDFAELCVIG
jgi:hypothetical protein